jgi:hypothetical protein
MPVPAWVARVVRKHAGALGRPNCAPTARTPPLTHSGRAPTARPAAAAIFQQPAGSALPPLSLPKCLCYSRRSLTLSLTHIAVPSISVL